MIKYRPGKVYIRTHPLLTKNTHNKLIFSLRCFVMDSSDTLQAANMSMTRKLTA